VKEYECGALPRLSVTDGMPGDVGTSQYSLHHQSTGEGKRPIPRSSVKECDRTRCFVEAVEERTYTADGAAPAPVC
jgi:hypothetical protein